MHNLGKEMACWAMNKAKTCGYDNLTSQDWDDLKDCLEAAKAAVCIDKDYKIIEAMKEAEEEEKVASRMGYNSRRYANGQYAPMGRGSIRGYMMPLYPEEDDYTLEWAKNPNDFKANMRMGYNPQIGGTGGTNGWNPGMSADATNGTAGTPLAGRNRYGEAYEGWQHARRNYTETHDQKSKDDMESYTKDHVHMTVDTMLKMYKDADPQLKTEMKKEVTKLMEQM